MRSRGWLAFAQRLERRWRKQTEVLRIRDHSWRYSRSPLTRDPVQGWKIHVSATILSASDIFARTFPVLNAHGALYKVPAKLSFLAHLNSGDAGYSQIGKFITIYTRSDKEAKALARKLHTATRGLAAPAVPFDIHYRRGSSVYYRYGAFAVGLNGAPSHIFDLAAKPHRDRRAPGCAIPPWLEDLFKKRQFSRRKPRGPIGLDYHVFKAFAQRGKGGVFEALDLSVFPARLVVIKQGRQHGDTDWNGDDGFIRVKREGKILRQLRAAGIPVPKVFREFEQNGSRYVVLEKISGRPLISRKALHPTRPSWRRALKILEGVGPLLSQLHEAGWVWRDCKPAHIFWNKGVIRLIDFEGACHLDETELLPWGSRNYVPPEYRGKFSRRPGVLEDHYALGVIAFQLMCGEFPPNHWHSHSSLYKRADCPDFLRAWTDNLLRC